MKIVIAGRGKSGTTALFYALKQSLPADYAYLFEPKSYERQKHRTLAKILRHQKWQKPRVLTKILIAPHTRLDDFDHFDKRILIVRDPRDHLVSWLLYQIYNSAFALDDVKVRRFVEHLEEKRAAPRAVTLLKSLSILSELSGEDALPFIVKNAQLALDFDTRARGYFVYKYEDFVAGKYAGLEKYLRLQINFDGQVEKAVERVSRTHLSGDWGNWFTPQDIEHFRPLFHNYLLRYGYDTAWALKASPQILPQYSTEYVMRLVRERQAQKL